jgi:hypothetical protein
MLVGLPFTGTLLILVGLAFSEELPSLLSCPSPLQGLFTVSEALFFFLLGLPFLEELPLLEVGPFLLVALLEELLPFLVGLPFLHVHSTTLTQQFTVVVGVSPMQGHFTVTEELTMGISVFEGPLTF